MIFRILSSRFLLMRLNRSLTFTSVLSPQHFYLSVTGRTTGQRPCIENLVLFNEASSIRILIPTIIIGVPFGFRFLSLRGFVGIGCINRRPFHGEDLALWSDEFFRIAMTFEAPFHL